MSVRCCYGLCWLPDTIQFNLIQYEVKHEESRGIFPHKYAKHKMSVIIELSEIYKHTYFSLILNSFQFHSH